MPKISNIVEQLSNIGIILLEPFINSKVHHLMKCVECGIEWTATPNSKIQNFKKHGAGGCPSCTKNRKRDRFEESRKTTKNKIKELGFEVLTESYDGNQDSKSLISVQNKHCGHVFEISPTNLIQKKVNCPICNISKRSN